MKYLFGLATILFAQVSVATSFMDSFIKENRGSFEYPLNEYQLIENKLYRTMKQTQNIDQKLQTIKYELINGNLEKAKVMLLQSKYNNDYSTNIQYRYLGIIHFIQGDYKKSLEYLTQKSMYNLNNYSSVCLLRTLNYILLNDTTRATYEWNRCIDATINNSSTAHQWMNTILKLKLKDQTNITQAPFEKIFIENEKGDYLRLFLKMALYLNQEDKILDRLSLLTADVYQQNELRELIGMLFYRKGKLSKAYDFVEDLESPNAENIKGNLYLAQKKYQLAYGQFKLALRKKIDSQNALERIIPVAWMLKQWEEGLNYVRRLDVPSSEYYEQMTLEVAFLTQAKKYKEAQIKLEQIVQGSNNAQSSEVNQLYAYNSIVLKDNEKAKNYADYSCKFKDGINCWLQFHLAIWENFAITAHREDKVFEEISDLTQEYTKEIQHGPLQEEVYINQRDIEILDNEIIQLLPTASR